MTGNEKEPGIRKIYRHLGALAKLVISKLDDPDCAAISNKLLHSEKSVAMLPISR